MTPGPKYTVVYDGSCNVCKRLVTVIEKADKRGSIEVVASQQPGITARFPSIPEQAYRESVQVIRASDGKIWQGAAALEQILDLMPKGKLISWVFSIPFMRSLTEKFYRWFARNRYRLGCDAHGQVCDPGS